MATNPPKKPENGYPNWAIFALLAFFLVLFWTFRPTDTGVSYEISYSEFRNLVEQGQVIDVQLSGRQARGTLANPRAIGPSGGTSDRFVTRLPAFGDDSVLALLEEQDVEIKVLPERSEGAWGPLLAATLPWIILLGVWFWIMRRSYRNIVGGLGGRSGGELGQFLDSTVKKAEVPKVTFNDVAGQDSAKREVSELIEFLKHPDQYRKVGAEVPRGVLLMGPPGTGKTLMARALAGEADVPFFSISGSEFIEVFVGVGASRVRRLFEAAKKHAPSIIFIDELDSVGRTRGTGLGGGHDEREQTLNQILAQLDGFEGHEAVIVLAATNRPDVLDPALLRPGRFDRHVTLELPDLNDRVAVLEVHTKNVPLEDDVDLETIAAGTPGFSGADIKNLVNEAAMIAAQQALDKVAMHHFDEARDKILLGAVRTLAIQPEEKHRLAVHEAGHTLVAYFLPHADPLYKVTIIPRGHALGGTHQLPEKERHTLPEEYLRDRLSLTLAGRCAEKELLDSVSSGADDDIRQATRLARAMVSRWGMAKDIGPVDLRESEEHPFLGREMAQPRHYSESSAELVDKAVRQILLESEERALEIIRSHREQLDRLVSELESQETLGREQIEKCLGVKNNQHEIKAASN
jgi:cell division protease FtsH